jgi:hypothetical protein
MSNFDVQGLLENSQKRDFEVKMNKAKKFIAKWEATGLLDGDDLKSQKYGKERMAEILENQAKQLVTEQSQTGTGASFATGQGENWAGVALPLVRKIFADISSKEFVSVQPMSLPSGLVFYLEFKYGSNRPAFNAGAPGTANQTRFNIEDSLYGNTSTKNTSPFSGLYGPGRFNYSTNYSTASVNFLSGSAVVYSDINFNANYSASIAGLTKFSVGNLSIVAPGVDTNGVRAFSATGSTINESLILAEFTTYNSGSDTLTLIVSASGLLNQSGSLYYYLQPKDNSRGDFEDTATRPITGSSAIPDVNLEMRSEAIVAKTRKLKAQWTPEFSQDLNAYQSLDAEAEVTSILSEYISMEIDLEILDMLIENANTVDYWSAQPGNVINATQTAFTTQSLTYTSQGAWFQTLGTKIQKVSNIIHQKTLRGGANFLVLSPTISTVLESIPGYAADTNGDKMQYNMGVQKAGMINSRQKVYKNPYMTENVILMGYRGSQFLETGAVYSPYIPLIMTPLVYDPNTFTPRKGIMTRYAKKMVRPEFYGKIFIADLQSL